MEMAMNWLASARQQAPRFWAKVRKTSTCWLWVAGKDKDGYGKFAITAPTGVQPKQRHVRAHRLAWELRHGRPFPPGKVTRHSCDTPACVRPSHIRPGTQKQNRLDTVNRGRQPRGEQHSRARLTERQVIAIRRRLGLETHAVLAAEYGVCIATIGHIASGRNWRHVGATRRVNSKASKRGTVQEIIVT